MVEAKINRLTGIEPTHGETIQGQRYAVGQQFKPHHDFFYTNQPYWPEMEKQGGQRTWTAMIFLNEPEAGGQTFFPNAKVRVTPRTGNLLLWNNLDQYGEPNTFSLHTGCPVEAGIKYVITKWYRERPWGWYATARRDPGHALLLSDLRSRFPRLAAQLAKQGPMNKSTLLLAAASLAGLSACAARPPARTAAAAAAAPAAPQASEAERLKRLFHESDEANLRRNPIGAIFRGDLRYADRLGDFITDEYFAAERAAGEADLAALRAIDRSKLSATDRIAYDVFEWQTRDSLKNLEPEMLALGVVRPINHMSGFHTFYPAFASGEGAAPFKTVADYENNLKRHKDYVVYHDRAIGRFRAGHGLGRLRDQADHPQRDRPARSADRPESGGIAILRADSQVSRPHFPKPTRRA